MQFVPIYRSLRCRMRLMCRLIGVPLLLASLYSLPALSAPLTLEQAWQQAEQANPTLRARQANLAAAQGELTDAHAPLWNNPQLNTEWRKRAIPQTANPARSNQEWTVGLAQTFEIAGQQGKRRNAAEQALAATQEVITETRRQLRAEVEQRFVQVLSLQLRIDMEGGRSNSFKTRRQRSVSASRRAKTAASMAISPRWKQSVRKIRCLCCANNWSGDGLSWPPCCSCRPTTSPKLAEISIPR